MGKSAKGGQFERRICYALGQWWGQDDDIFWRSAGSGAKATSRWKRLGKRSTIGTGDIIATKPTGQAFTDLFCVECKRGYSHISVFDLIDRKPTNFPGRTPTQPVERIIKQAVTASVLGGSVSWMWIHQRNSREIIVTIDMDIGHHFHHLIPYANILYVGHRPVMKRLGINALLSTTWTNFSTYITADLIRDTLSCLKST